MAMTADAAPYRATTATRGVRTAAGNAQLAARCLPAVRAREAGEFETRSAGKTGHVERPPPRRDALGPGASLPECEYSGAAADCRRPAAPGHAPARAAVSPAPTAE